MRLSLRAADNAPDPSRGLAGYVTTYQGIAAAPDLHLREFRRHRTLLVVDEVHHLPALADTDPDAARRAATTGRGPGERLVAGRILPLLECARVRLLLSGTLERGGRARHPLAALPQGAEGAARARSSSMRRAGRWSATRRAQALQERAVLPVTFGALDGEASWRAEEGVEVGPHRLAAPYPTETTRPALFTALRTGFAEALLRRGLPGRARPARPATAGARPRRRATPPSAWASCWWSRPTRRTPRRYLETASGAGSRAARRGTWRSSRPRTRRGAHEARGRLPAAAGAVDPGHGRHGL